MLALIGAGSTGSGLIKATVISPFWSEPSVLGVVVPEANLSGFAEFALLSKIFGYKLFHVVKRLAVLGPLCVHASRLIQVISRELRLSVCGVSESKPSRDHVASARVKVVQPQWKHLVPHWLATPPEGFTNASSTSFMIGSLALLCEQYDPLVRFAHSSHHHFRPGLSPRDGTETG